MPIDFISSQPIVDALTAAYRPIVLSVRAKNTDGTPIPPVVFCDIYINAIYYRTLSKTQYASHGGLYTVWSFDIQDALQEYLGKFVGLNGGSTIVEAPSQIANVFCKFRSSGMNSEGFIISENVAPVQGIGNVMPVPGTGTVSNIFYVINATLQHEDHQTITTHLNAFKYREWDFSSYPLTHRPDHYKVCLNDSDYYPIVTDKIIGQLTLHFLPKNSLDWQTDVTSLPCEPTVIGTIAFVNGFVGVPYANIIYLGGHPPFTLTNIVKPAWMTITVVGNSIEFSGTPQPGDAGVNIPVTFDIVNCCGVEVVPFSGFLTVEECIAVSADAFAPPDAIVGTAYSYTYPLSGTAPFSISASGINIPSWMSVGIFGNDLVLSGIPPIGTLAATGVPVELIVQNCDSANELPLADTINIIITETVPCKLIELTKTTGNPSAFYTTCAGVDTNTGIFEHTFICTNGRGFTISGGGVVVNSSTDGNC